MQTDAERSCPSCQQPDEQPDHYMYPPFLVSDGRERDSCLGGHRAGRPLLIRFSLLLPASTRGQGAPGSDHIPLNLLLPVLGLLESDALTLAEDLSRPLKTEIHT